MISYLYGFHSNPALPWSGHPKQPLIFSAKQHLVSNIGHQWSAPSPGEDDDDDEDNDEDHCQVEKIYFVLKIISAGVRELDAFIQTVLHSFAQHKSKVVLFIFLPKYQNYDDYDDSHIPLWHWSYANIPCLLHSSSGRFPAIVAILLE